MAVNNRRRFFVALSAIVATALVALVFGLFHGYFDHGRFEVKEAVWSQSGRVAVVAERSDHEAMSSDVYFVLIGDHVFSPPELRIAYYSSNVLFAAANPCITAQWNNPNSLTVACLRGFVDSSRIEVQRRLASGVAVTYLNIAEANSGQK
jgi:hypothetical protein